MEPGNSLAMLQGLGLGAIAISVIIGLAIASGLLLLSMKILSIPGRSFWKALGVVILASIISIVITAVLAMVFDVGMLITAIFFIVNLLVTAGFIALFCKSSYGRSLGAAALYWVFMIILIIIFNVVLLGMLGAAAA